MKSLFRPSGGIRYHARAVARQRLWAPFAAEVAAWLETWSIPHQQLTLIGPSAGYSLPTTWLNQFKQIQAYDLDPLAPLLFRRRHPGVPVTFHQRDMFWSQGQLSSVPIADMPGPILFCNILGQLPLEGEVSEPKWELFLQQLRTTLKGRSWASYHDLFSVESVPHSQHQMIVQRYARAKDITAVLTGLRVDVTDHMLAGQWSADLENTLFTWSLSRNRLHIVSGVRSDS